MKLTHSCHIGYDTLLLKLYLEEDCSGEDIQHIDKTRAWTLHIDHPQNDRFYERIFRFCGAGAGKNKRLSKRVDLFPISGPIACFHNADLEKLYIEMGWQIVRHVDSKDEIICSRIPSRKVVTAIDLGPYEEQDPTLMDIFEWIKARNLTPQGPIYYCYLNDTERPATEYLTQMSLPVQSLVL